MKWLFYLLFAGLLAFGIYRSAIPDSDLQTAQEKVDEAVVTKIASWLGRRERDCRQRALDIALTRADSLIMEFAREQKLMIDRPSRPLRPEEPALRRPNDTLKLRPFLSDSL